MESYNINTSQVEGIDKEHTRLTVGKAALVHSIIQEGSPTYERKALKKSIPKHIRKGQHDVEKYKIKNRLVKFSLMDNSYHIIETDNIHSSSFVIPYDYKDKDKVYLEGLATSVLVLSSINEWNSHFIDYNNTDIKKEAEKRKDDDINRNDEIFPYEG